MHRARESREKREISLWQKRERKREPVSEREGGGRGEARDERERDAWSSGHRRRFTSTSSSSVTCVVFFYFSSSSSSSRPFPLYHLYNFSDIFIIWSQSHQHFSCVTV